MKNGVISFFATHYKPAFITIDAKKAKTAEEFVLSPLSEMVIFMALMIHD